MVHGGGKTAMFPISHRDHRRGIGRIEDAVRERATTRCRKHRWASKSVDRLLATLGNDMPTSRVAVPEKNVARNAVEQDN
jgi:hypothetical protein